MKSIKFLITLLMLSLFLMSAQSGCGDGGAKTDSGVKKVKTVVKVGADGMTSEQKNIVDFYKVDNKPGALKHFYCISPMSGQVILYSSVRGKVTSSRKTARPTKAMDSVGQPENEYRLGGTLYYTDQQIQDSGTYGSDDPPYIYWIDLKGLYHKHFVNAGCIVHITNAPLAIKSVVINVENYKVSKK